MILMNASRRHVKTLSFISDTDHISLFFQESSYSVLYSVLPVFIFGYDISGNEMLIDHNGGLFGGEWGLG